MPKIKEESNKNGVYICRNLAQNTNLSCSARSMLMYLLSLPDDEEPKTEIIAKKFGKSPSTIRWIFRELKSAGYVHYHKIGFGTDWKYYVFEKPTTIEEFKNFLQK